MIGGTTVFSSTARLFNTDQFPAFAEDTLASFMPTYFFVVTSTLACLFFAVLPSVVAQNFNAQSAWSTVQVSGP